MEHETDTPVYSPPAQLLYTAAEREERAERLEWAIKCSEPDGETVSKKLASIVGATNTALALHAKIHGSSEANTPVKYGSGPQVTAETLPLLVTPEPEKPRTVVASPSKAQAKYRRSFNPVLAG